MSQSEVEDFLEHHGIKGMKWGVRRDLQKLRTSSERKAYLDSKDAKWIAKVQADPKVAKVSKRVASEMKSYSKRLKKERMEKFSDSSRAGKLFRQNVWSSADKAAYNANMKAHMEQTLDAESYKAHGWSPTRTREVRFEPQSDGTLKATVVQRSNYKIAKQQGQIAKSDARRDRREANEAKKVQHEDDLWGPDNDPYEGMSLYLTLDENGFVDDVLTPFDIEEVKHMDNVEDFLEHHGIKGMKWGVRRENPSGKPRSTSKTSTSTSTVEKKSSSSASKPAATPRKKMTDAELREKINRLQMEKQYKQLMAEKNPKKKAAKEFIISVIKDAGKQAATDILSTAAKTYGKQVLGGAMAKSKNPAVSVAGNIIKSQGLQKEKKDK